MNAVQLVTIKSLRTLYKNGEAAERIELANVEEHNFDIVVQKGLYNIGDKAVYMFSLITACHFRKKRVFLTLRQLNCSLTSQCLMAM